MAQYNKIVLAAGTGQIGKALINYFKDKCHTIVVLSRKPSFTNGNIVTINWDAKTLDNWWQELDGADVLINLAGKNVNCRYNAANKKEIIESRINSVTVLAQAVAKCKRAPALWIQSASATIYRHAEDKPMTELDGELGNGFSVEVCKSWEQSFLESTKKIDGMRKIILRTSLVLSKHDGVLPRLRTMALWGLGGAQGNGRQMMSWIHEEDVCRMIEWLMQNKKIQGVFNCTAPEPITNRNFMKALRNSLNRKLALPSPKWLLSLGAIVIGTETELILKSRWVLPERAIKEGFKFTFNEIGTAFENLLSGK